VSWPLVTLKSLTEIIDYGLTASANNDVDGPLFLRITDLKESGVDWLAVPRCECDVKQKAKNLLGRGDIVFARTGATTGKSYLITDLKEETVFASYLIRVRPNHKVNSEYLAHFFKSPIYWYQISGMSTGATLPGVNASKLGSLEIPLPPLDDQKRIAAILDKADTIRRKRQQAIQLADDFLRSVFLDMFGDPVTNPKGWEVKSLKELTNKLGSGSTPRGGKEAYLEEGISLIRSLNVHDNKFLHKNLAFISDKQAEKLKNVIIEKGDLLLNITGASVCRASLVDNDILPARVNQHVCIIRTKPDKILPTFLARLITSSSYKQKLMSIATAGGATREALTKQQVESLDIIVPPFEVQEKFESIVGKVFQLLKSSELQSQKPLFNSLSQQAFAGEL